MINSNFSSIKSFVKREQRQDFIKEKTAAKQSFTTVYLNERSVDIPVISVPNNMVIYRMNNGRTATDQNAFIQENEKEQDFFITGQEKPIQQHYQHTFLLNLANDSKGNIFKELKEVKEQRENLIATTDGVVVNGNRRLAAMRELFIQNPSEFSKFEYISIAILPENITEVEIELLEADLQLKPETKLEYDWISQRLKLRYQSRDLGIPYDKLIEVYRFKNNTELNAMLEQLSLAEEYLETCVKMPFYYDEVADKYQFFKDLQKSLASCPTNEKSARKLLAFILAKNSKKIKGRIYRYNDVFDSSFQSVVDVLIEEENITNAAPNDTQIDIIDDENDIMFLFDDDDDSEEEVDYSGLESYLENEANQDRALAKVTNIFDSQKELENEKNKGEAALKFSENAYRTLSNIDLSQMNQNIEEAVLSQLKGICNLSQSLISQIEKKV